MRNTEDTPADGFPRVTGPLARRHPGDNRPDWTAPGEAEVLANDEALRYSARRPATGGAAWGAAPEPPRPGSAPRRPGPAAVRPGEAGSRSLGPRPATVRPGQPAPRRAGLQPPAAPPVAVTGRPASRDAGPPHRAGTGALAQVPYVVVLLIAAVGIWWAWRGSHDVGNGAGVVGGAVLAAAIARLALPQSAVGLLASRRRFADVLALGAFGAGLLVLALVLPPT